MVRQSSGHADATSWECASNLTNLGMNSPSLLSIADFTHNNDSSWAKTPGSAEGPSPTMFCMTLGSWLEAFQFGRKKQMGNSFSLQSMCRGSACGVSPFHLTNCCFNFLFVLGWVFSFFQKLSLKLFKIDALIHPGLGKRRPKFVQKTIRSQNRDFAILSGWLATFLYEFPQRTCHSDLYGIPVIVT